MTFFRLFVMLVLLLGLVTPCQAQQYHAINLGHVQAQGIIGWWRGVPGLTGGTTLTNLVGGGNATLTNMGFGTTSGWVASDRRGGLWHVAFDGTDDYAALSDNSLYESLNTTFTLAFWFKATTPATTGYLVAKRVTGTGSNQGAYFIRLNNDGTLSARILNTGNGSAGDRPSLSTTNGDGTWRHLAVVFTTDTTVLANNDVTIYREGEVDYGARTDSSASAAGACACPLTFGSQSDQAAGTFLTGALDDIRLYNRGLTQAEVRAIRASTLQGDADLLVQPGLPVAYAPAGGNPGAFFPFFR